MRVLIVGGSGLIGGALAESLVRDSHEAVVLSRSPERQALPRGVRAAPWDGRTLGTWVEELEHAEAVVNLAGESVFGRWTAARKKRMRDSRVGTSRLVAEAFAAVKRRPLVLMQGSAVGYYGDTGDAVVEESFPPGNDFLSRLAVEWEAASASVEALGVRRPIVRTSIVLSRRGGALRPLRLAFRAFLGGRLGDGRQWMPWIHEADEVGAIRFLLESPAAAGPFNLAAPEAARNDDLSRALAKALRRPSWLPAPKLAVRLALGELGETMLSGQRAVPSRLLALGFRFRFPTLEAAFAELLA
ncbi:MAG TPA: TIGR01777 family oxidoreductase [Thermoanaerobaculia bacterium]|nr:TIGR01777 family oxidoreductase [Thermoanaerobaculia bacterium]